MNNIKFSHNWNNKLNQPIFTTIRKSNFKKYQYYYSKINKLFNILLNNKKIGEAILLAVEELEYEKIPKALLMVDTGIDNIEKVKRVFEKFKTWDFSKILILTFLKNE